MKCKVTLEETLPSLKEMNDEKNLMVGLPHQRLRVNDLICKRLQETYHCLKAKEKKLKSLKRKWKR